MVAYFNKKMVEILFARGLVKVLFATETFAMVNQMMISLKKK
jgi:superfamily II RNA helicase